MSSTLGARLREAREASGLRREVVAVSIDKSMSSVLAYERDVVEPPLHVVRNLARLYQVSLADLVGEVPANAA